MPKVKSGGVETTIINSIDKLNKIFDYEVVSLEKSDKQNVDIKCISGACGYISTIKNLLKKLLFGSKLDVVVFSLWKSSLIFLMLYPIFKIKRIKTVVFIHSSFFAHTPDLIVTSIAVKLCDDVFCDSYSSKRFIESKTKKKCNVVSFLSRKLVKHELKNNDFVFIARLNKSKGIRTALEIFHYVNKKLPDVIFHIYGPDEGELTFISDFVKKNCLSHAVKYCGEIDNLRVPDILSCYRFYLQPSLKEGMGISVMEAMQVGLIPIVYPIGELEFYTSDMVNSVHLYNYSIEDNANRIIKIIQDEDVKEMMSLNASAQFSHYEEYCISFSKLLHGVKNNENKPI